MALFFATKNDILPVLRGVEAHLPVKYVGFGHFPTPTAPVYHRGEDIPDLGIAPGESHASCPCFLVCDPSLKLNAYPVDGGRVRVQPTTKSRHHYVLDGRAVERHFAVRRLSNLHRNIFHDGQKTTPALYLSSPETLQIHRRVLRWQGSGRKVAAGQALNTGRANS
jgi:hypothetical protein